MLMGSWLSSSHLLKSRAKACSDMYRSEGHQSAGKLKRSARNSASTYRDYRVTWQGGVAIHPKQWDSFPESELRMSHLDK